MGPTPDDPQAESTLDATAHPTIARIRFITGNGTTPRANLYRGAICRIVTGPPSPFRPFRVKVVNGSVVVELP
jgi:hypothetical protein